MTKVFSRGEPQSLIIFQVDKKPYTYSVVMTILRFCSFGEMSGYLDERERVVMSAASHGMPSFEKKKLRGVELPDNAVF